MKKIFFVSFTVALLSLTNLFAQNPTSTGRNGDRKVNGAKWDDEYQHDSDTLYYVLPSVSVSSRVTFRKFDNKKDQKRYDRLVYSIKKVYPYAKRASIVLHEEEAKVVGMDKGERREHMKKVEKRIEKEFGKDLKKLTFTQGTILLKLIDRETGYTSYELLDDLRGSFRAWFYDGIAGLFDYDLKGEFDPHNNLGDRYIDEVVRAIEAGQIQLGSK